MSRRVECAKMGGMHGLRSGAGGWGVRGGLDAAGRQEGGREGRGGSSHAEETAGSSCGTSSVKGTTRLL